MSRIEVGRYSNPENVGGFTGWINPERKDEHKVPEWMLFIKSDGTVMLGIRNDDDQLEF